MQSAMRDRSIDRSTTVAPTALSGTGSLLPSHGLVPTRSGRPVRAKRRARRAAALLALPERCTTGQDARQPRHVQSSRMLLHGGRIRTASSPVDSGRPRHRQARSVGRPHLKSASRGSSAVQVGRTSRPAIGGSAGRAQRATGRLIRGRRRRRSPPERTFTPRQRRSRQRASALPALFGSGGVFT